MQFYEQNQFRAYPFREDARLVGTVTGSDSICIANAAFVDLRITLSKTIPEGPTVLESIAHQGVNLLLHLSRGAYPLSIQVPVSNEVVTRGSDPAGVYTFLVVTGPALTTLAEAIGSGNTLTLTSAPELVPTLVRDASGASVHSISDGTTVLTGPVILEEGFNCEASVSRSRIHLVPRLGRGAGTSCEDTAITCAKALFRINGQEANSKGEFRLVGGKGILISPRPSQHTIDISATNSDDCKV